MELPENLQPYAAALAKHHFWLLALLVPILTIPAVLVAEGHLTSRIDAAQREIKSKLQAIDSVRAIDLHPNGNWVEAIDTQTREIKLETLQTWQQAYAKQDPLRVWPESLGEDFLSAAARIPAGGRLSRPFRERYQNGVPRIVRTLPGRMGANEQMLERNDRAESLDGRERGERLLSTAMVDWPADDQKRIYESFVWRNPPSTRQVALAQEEVWVYGMICDAIARANAGAQGHYNAVIPTVSRVAVGYEAAEEKPGGMESDRIFLPKQGPGMPGAGRFPGAGGFPGAESGMQPGMAGEGGLPGGGPLPGPRPPHPRFSGDRGMSFSGEPFAPRSPTGTAPGMAGAEPAATDPDDMLLNWIYVDFEGRPLTAAEINASVAARMVHLMPFTIALTIDQNALDRFLVDLATVPTVPFDVRQVRINAEGEGGRRSESRSGRTSGSSRLDEGTAASRPSDVEVELRGVIPLIATPDPQVVGLTAEDLPGEEGNPTAAPTEEPLP